MQLWAWIRSTGLCDGNDWQDQPEHALWSYGISKQARPWQPTIRLPSRSFATRRDHTKDCCACGWYLAVHAANNRMLML